MPDISSEASNVQFCASMALAPGFCFTGDVFAGEENNPVISSRPFSSNLAGGRVTPVRLKNHQHIEAAPAGSIAYRPAVPTAE